MNKIQSRLRLLTAVFAGAAMLLLSGAGMADPPTRVARLSFFSGPVSFSPAGEDEWVLATPNRPLITGDRLWADAGGRAELQAGSIALRLGASTNVNVLNLDDRATQLELTQGSLYVRVWRIDRGDTVEIDTPNLAFTVNSVGRYRIDVDADGNVTTLAVGRTEVKRTAKARPTASAPAIATASAERACATTNTATSGHRTNSTAGPRIAIAVTTRRFPRAMYRAT
jgi:hypothetical protein